MSGFRFQELSQAAEMGDTEEGYRHIKVKAKGPKGESKWLRFTPEEFDEILNLVQDDED